MINKNLFKFNFKKDKSYLLIYGLLFLAVFPLPVLVTKINMGIAHYDNIAGISSYIIFAIILVLITPFIQYNYLFSKKSVDVYHAIPVKRSELFVTQFISSLILVLIPFTINYFLGNILIMTLFNTKVDFMFQNYLSTIFFLLIIQSLSTFIILNTGTLLDSLIHTIIFLIYPFFIFLTLNVFSDRFLFGLNGIPDDGLRSLSPLYAIFYVLNKDPFPISLIIYWAIIFLGFFLVQKRMYLKRKSEKSEEPFTNDWYFPVSANIFTGFMFVFINVAYNSVNNLNERSISSFFSIDAILISIILTFVGYAFLNLFRYRSTKFLKKTIKDYIIIVLISSLLSTLVIETQYFNRVWKVPKANEIQSIEFDSNELYWINPILNPRSNHYTNNIVDDQEFIVTFVKFHNSINNKIRKQKQFYRNGNPEGLINQSLSDIQNETINFTFTYNLKNGKRLNRNLNIPRSLFVDNFILKSNYKYQSLIHPILSSKYSIQDVKLYNNILSEYVILDSENIKKLRNEYEKDLNSLDLSELIYNKSHLRYIIKYSYTDKDFTQVLDYMFIDERFSNSITFLNSLFIDPITEPNTFYQYPDNNHDSFNNGPIQFESFSFYGEIVDKQEVDLKFLSEHVLGSHLNENDYHYLNINEQIRIPVDKK